MTKASKNDHAPDVNMKIKWVKNEKRIQCHFLSLLKLVRPQFKVAVLKVQEEHLKTTKTNWCN